jgi:hypothetical protein
MLGSYKRPCCCIVLTVVAKFSVLRFCRAGPWSPSILDARRAILTRCPSCAAAAVCAAAECGRRGLAVKPRKGAALLFWSLQPDGKTKDMHSLHGGCPVIKGDKWSATKWIRVHEHQVWN